MSKKENYIEYYQILQNLVTQTFEFLIKIFYSFFYFCFNFIKNLIKFCFKFTKEIFYFLTESLTRNELFCLIIFVIFFVFTDRQSNKKIKFEKQKLQIYYGGFLVFFFIFLRGGYIFMRRLCFLRNEHHL